MQIKTTGQYLFPSTEINTGFCFALFCFLKDSCCVDGTKIQALWMRGELERISWKVTGQLVSRALKTHRPLHPLSLLLGAQSKN